MVAIKESGVTVDNLVTVDPVGGAINNGKVFFDGE